MSFLENAEVIAARLLNDGTERIKSFAGRRDTNAILCDGLVEVWSQNEDRVHVISGIGLVGPGYKDLVMNRQVILLDKGYELGLFYNNCNNETTEFSMVRNL